MSLVVLSAVLALVAAQQNPTNFCRRHQHQTCVIDSKLYIDGGLVYYGGGITKDSVPQRNTYLLWEDFKEVNDKVDFPPQYFNLTKGADVPTTSGGVLWPDQVNKLFYLYGGEYNNASVQSFQNLWFYDTIYNTWNSSKGSDGSQSQISWPAFGSGTVSDDGIAYYYGGYLSNKSVAGWTGDRLMLNSLVSLNMGDISKSRRPMWNNDSLSSVTPRAEGTLQYIPASDKGMLVNFGGVETNTSGQVVYSNMSQIRLYDIASNVWYTQTASGDIPQARRAFCAGVAYAKDYSSYNFYVFGGIGANETALGDLYILSLPSFQWVSWYPDPQRLTFPGGKAWASCDVINHSQMIIMSGKLTNATAPACDAPSIGGQHGLLLGQESIEENNLWHRMMMNVTEYRVPQNITRVIGGGTDGKASLTTPAVGWATSDLSINFAKKAYTADSRTATRPIPTTSSPVAPPPPSPSSSSKTNVGAIAGGVIGGVVALIAVIAIAFFCLRSRRRRRDATAPTDAPPISQHHHQRTDTVGDKSLANYSVSQGSTLHSPNAQMAYSPHDSIAQPSDVRASSNYQYSPQLRQYSGSEWAQQGGYGHGLPPGSGEHVYQQTYYPPPPEPSQSPRSAELPSTKTPGSPAELPNVNSPQPMRGLF